jgi:hypothetical protein
LKTNCKPLTNYKKTTTVQAAVVLLWCANDLQWLSHAPAALCNDIKTSCCFNTPPITSINPSKAGLGGRSETSACWAPLGPREAYTCAAGFAVTFDGVARSGSVLRRCVAVKVYHTAVKNRYQRPSRYCVSYLHMVLNTRCGRLTQHFLTLIMETRESVQDDFLVNSCA